MLPLTDPLWTKLDDAHRDRNIPALLRSLAKTWDDEAANSLFYDCLCHQETCYGATYATIPHLLKIARPEQHRHQRLEIALFLAIVVLNAVEPQRSDDDERKGVLPNGLPDTIEAWDKKRDVYRGLARHPARSEYEESQLPLYRKILAVPPVDPGDLRKIERIRAEFFAALPKVRALCERAFLENLEDDDAAPYLLSGVAAADRLLGLARLLELGDEGRFQCSLCGWKYDYQRFEDRLAFYEDDELNSTLRPRAAGQDRSLEDYRAGVPSRQDGFVEPAADSDPVDPPVAELFALAMRARSARPALLLRHFLGNFRCIHCGSRGPMCTP